MDLSIFWKLGKPDDDFIWAVDSVFLYDVVPLRILLMSVSILAAGPSNGLDGSGSGM